MLGTLYYSRPVQSKSTISTHLSKPPSERMGVDILINEIHYGDETPRMGVQTQCRHRSYRKQENTTSERLRCTTTRDIWEHNKAYVSPGSSEAYGRVLAYMAL